MSLSRNLIVNCIFYLLLLSVFFIMRGQQVLALPDLQYSLAPFFIVLLYFLIIRTLSLGRYVLLTAFILLGSTYYFYKLNAYVSNDDFLFARLTNDKYESAGKILKDNISKEIDKLARISLDTLPKEFANLKEIQNYLIAHPQIKFLTWGKSNWINITLKTEPDFRLSESPLVAAIGDMQVISTPPSVGIFYEPVEYTAKFLAHLLNAFDGLSKEDPWLGIANLERAARMLSGWKNINHTSLPHFLLGNHHFFNVLRSAEYQSAELGCAIEEYKSAFAAFRRRQNPEMAATIANNLGVAFYLRSYFEDRPKDRFKAKKYFALAFKTMEFDNPYGVDYRAPYLAKANLLLIKKGKKFKRQSRKQRLLDSAK